MPDLALTVDFEFAAAHRLPRYDGPCSRMHGHNYKLTVTVRGGVDPSSGMVVDFEKVRRVVWDSALSRWDHQTMNDFLENPTAENMVVALWELLRGTLPGLVELTLHETSAYRVSYRGEAHGS
jgi:6-pyruvoyltetrahydropterin/6-carboxytetrahydropterin synthase